MQERDPYINALIELHVGLERQGPGDPDFSKEIIENLPQLQPEPRIADLGCGAGAGTLILAEHYRTRIRAVDFSREFLNQLMQRARQQSLQQFIDIIDCDIGQLPWTPRSIDLLWCEGAAYTVGFATALAAWRPLLADAGIAVISEMNYFAAEVPEVVSGYLRQLYPGILDETENAALIESSGYRLIESRRLPASAWRKNYYDPLSRKMDSMSDTGDKWMRQVIAETRAEIDFFKTHDQDFGYTYYIMRAA